MPWESRTTWSGPTGASGGQTLTVAEQSQVAYDIESRNWPATEGDGTQTPPSSATSWADAGDPGTSEAFDDTNLTVGRYYQYRVRARHSSFGTSGWTSGNAAATARAPMFSANSYTGNIERGEYAQTDILSMNIVVSDADVGDTVDVTLSSTDSNANDYQGNLAFSLSTVSTNTYQLNWVYDGRPLPESSIPFPEGQSTPSSITLLATATDQYGLTDTATIQISLREGPGCEDHTVEDVDIGSTIMGSFDSICNDPTDMLSPDLTYATQGSIPSQLTVTLSGTRSQMYEIAVAADASRNTSYSFTVRATDPDTSQTDDFNFTVQTALGGTLNAPTSVVTTVTFT